MKLIVNASAIGNQSLDPFKFECIAEQEEWTASEKYELTCSELIAKCKIILSISDDNDYVIRSERGVGIHGTEVIKAGKYMFCVDKE